MHQGSHTELFRKVQMLDQQNLIKTLWRAEISINGHALLSRVCFSRRLFWICCDSNTPGLMNRLHFQDSNDDCFVFRHMSKIFSFLIPWPSFFESKPDGLKHLWYLTARILPCSWDFIFLKMLSILLQIPFYSWNIKTTTKTNACITADWSRTVRDPNWSNQNPY